MTTLSFIGAAGACVGLTVGLATLFKYSLSVTRWAYRQARQAQETHEFVSALASNHLPHCFHALELICKKLEIELPEPPPIYFKDLNKE